MIHTVNIDLWNSGSRILSPFQWIIPTFGRSDLRHDSQCRYNEILRRVRATIVAVEKQWVLHNRSVCICSLRYSAGNAHAPCCHLWPAPLYNFFPRCLINGTIFGKKNTEHKMCVLIISTTFGGYISHSKKKWARYDQKRLSVFM